MLHLKLRRGCSRRAVYLLIGVLLLYFLQSIFKAVRDKQAVIKSEEEDTEPDFIDTEEEQPAVVKPSDDGGTIAQISAIVKEYSNDKAASSKSERRSARKPGQAKSSESSDKVLEKMKKTMLKEAIDQSIIKLVKPEEILKKAIGPISYRSRRESSIVEETNNSTTLADDGVKLVVVARDRTGYPVIQQFLNKKSGFFEHGEPVEDVSLVGNLLNCILEPTLVENFSLQMKGPFGRSPYFQTDCLLDSRSICSDPLSYELTCRRYKHQILRTRSFDLDNMQQLMQLNSDVKVILLVRDPRGSLKDKTGPEMKSFCQKLHADLQLASRLESEFAGQFVSVRFESLARDPRIEMTNLLKGLNIKQVNLNGIEESKDGWQLDKNSVSKINAWKQKLNMKQINKIEAQCLETLSRLEYPILGNI